MKFFWKKDEKSALDEMEEYLKHELKCTPWDDKESQKSIRDALTMIYQIKLDEKKAKFKISPDTIALIAANLVGIGLILLFEQKDIITSKALGFIIKPKI